MKPSTRDPKGHLADFSSGTDPRQQLEWEADERTQDAIFVGAVFTIALLGGWGLWIGYLRILDWLAKGAA